MQLNTFGEFFCRLHEMNLLFKFQILMFLLHTNIVKRNRKAYALGMIFFVIYKPNTMLLSFTGLKFS